MNYDSQPPEADVMDLRISRLFFREHQNTHQIGQSIGWHESAVDRSLSRILDGLHTIWPTRPPEVLQSAAGHSYVRGSRVRPSEIGARILWKLKPGRRGTVVGFCRDGRCINVRWDGNLTATAISLSFVEPDL
jgi:hypothetical protein